MADEAKAKKTLRSYAKPKAKPPPKKSKPAPGDASAGVGGKADNPAASASAESATWEPGSNEILVEELADGLVNALGEGLEALVNTRVATGSRLIPGIEAKAREAVSFTMAGVVNFCNMIDRVAGAGKDCGFLDEDPGLYDKNDK